MITPAKLLEDLERLTQECAENDIKYTEAKNAFSAWEDTKKIKFAYIVDKLEGKKSEREQKALISPEWAVYIDRLKELRYDYLLSQANRDATRREWDYVRSHLSMLKQEINKGI